MLDKKGSWQSIYDSHYGISSRPALVPEGFALTWSPEQHGSELANWNFDENSQPSQFLCAFHRDYDALDG
jgi:hypothetical protein